MNSWNDNSGLTNRAPTERVVEIFLSYMRFIYKLPVGVLIWATLPSQFFPPLRHTVSSTYIFSLSTSYTDSSWPNRMLRCPLVQSGTFRWFTLGSSVIKRTQLYRRYDNARAAHWD